MILCYADPMWLVPVSTFLQFEYLPSHQEALSKGMLVQYTSEIAGRVIFGEYTHVQLFTADLCLHSIARVALSRPCGPARRAAAGATAAFNKNDERGGERTAAEGHEKLERMDAHGRGHSRGVGCVAAVLVYLAGLSEHSSGEPFYDSNHLKSLPHLNLSRAWILLKTLSVLFIFTITACHRRQSQPTSSRWQSTAFRHMRVLVA